MTERISGEAGASPGGDQRSAAPCLTGRGGPSLPRGDGIDVYRDHRGGSEAVGGHRQHSRTGADIEDRETVARNLFEVHQRQPGRFVSSAAERGTRNHREPEPARRNTP